MGEGCIWRIWGGLHSIFVGDRRAVAKGFDIVLWSGAEGDCEGGF